jgi:hypothetical protein
LKAFDSAFTAINGASTQSKRLRRMREEGAGAGSVGWSRGCSTGGARTSGRPGEHQHTSMHGYRKKKADEWVPTRSQ